MEVDPLFSPDYRALLARYGHDHWWTAGMRRITWALIDPVESPLLDVGSGPGWLLGELPPGIWGVGVDLQPQIFGTWAMLEAEASHLPVHNAAFALVLALDLLEQSSVDPFKVLAEIHRVLRPGGRLLVRVPAHPWLWSPRDAFWGGARRYGRRELVQMIVEAGFVVRRLTYANSVLFPVAVAVRWLARVGLPGGIDLCPMPGRLNRWLLALLSFEARWLRNRNLPLGLSLICLAVA